MKRLFLVCLLVVIGSPSLAVAGAHDVQAELDKGLAFARAGDYATARTIWRTLARHGSPEAQFRLGWMFETGMGAEKNASDAALWYALAAEEGHASALYNLGVMLTEGRGVARNERKAAAKFRKAAVQGHAKAQYNLGILFQTGRGVPKDMRRAHFWLDRAKANGIVRPIITAQV